MPPIVPGQTKPIPALNIGPISTGRKYFVFPPECTTRTNYLPVEVEVYSYWLFYKEGLMTGKRVVCTFVPCLVFTIKLKA